MNLAVNHNFLSQWMRVCQRLLRLPRYHKRALVVGSDAVVLYMALCVASYLRFGEFRAPSSLSELLLWAAAPMITVGVFGWFGIYKRVTRFFQARTNMSLIAYFWLSVLIWSIVVFMAGQQGIPRSVIVGYGFLGAAAVIAIRQAAGSLLSAGGVQLPARPAELGLKPVIIYGAGKTGSWLINALRNSGGREAVAFVDTNENLWGQYIGGLKVFPPSRLGSLIERRGVKEVLLAFPELQQHQRRLIVDELRCHPVEVKILPAFEDLVSGRIRVTDLRTVEVADLLGRDAVPADATLLARSTFGKSILVTGAGGSIGSELARQIVRQKPARIVLLDAAEPALYGIMTELGEYAAANDGGAAAPEIVSVLGSVLDEALVHETLQTYAVQVVYHAAAYKHVPIVEHNPIVALNNNSLGTAIIAEAARAAKVERVVLVSTDKAVRPANVMGASKRLAELVFQAHAANGSDTIFAMVRFGNVLDSSGSVVRLFRRQIVAGGPVTVTHPDVIRYFMSIPEAAELVIQAGAMATGGEVFVLDMGEPIKIIDLARLMINLSGLQVRDLDHPNGDIEIVYTGLRPGEKLFEELLIGADTIKTEHPRIMKSNEPHLPVERLTRELEALKIAVAARDAATVRAILLRCVEGYRQPREYSRV